MLNIDFDRFWIVSLPKWLDLCLFVYQIDCISACSLSDFELDWNSITLKIRVLIFGVADGLGFQHKTHYQVGKAGQGLEASKQIPTPFLCEISWVLPKTKWKKLAFYYNVLRFFWLVNFLYSFCCYLMWIPCMHLSNELLFSVWLNFLQFCCYRDWKLTSQSNLMPTGWNMGE